MKIKIKAPKKIKKVTVRNKPKTKKVKIKVWGKKMLTQREAILLRG